MHRRWSTSLILGGLLYLLVGSSGCEQIAPPHNVEPKEAAQPNANDEPEDEPIIPGNGPIRREDEPLKTPMLEGLRQQIEQAPLSGEADDAVRNLSDQLSEADALYSEAKRQNRSAIQQANRQVRIGAAKRSPNFVLITIDRLGITDLSCYGQSQWQTPRIDELARSGLKLSNYYAGAGDAATGHQSLLTGCFSRVNPSNGNTGLLPRTLWNAGYRTAFVGDWSSASSLKAQGYEDWSGWNTTTNEYPDWAEINGRRVTLEDNLNDGRRVRRVKFLLSEVRSLMQESRIRGNPFFLHIAQSLFTDTDWKSFTRTDYERRVLAADEVVGGVLDVLRELGLTSHTWVLFTATAGPHPTIASVVRETQSTGEFRVSDHGLSEGNLRVPCLISWPREISSGSTADQVVGVWDLLPTVSELAAVNRAIPRTDGQTLKPLWHPKAATAARRLVWRSAFVRNGFAVRDGKWKAVKTSSDDAGTLFDLSIDPLEQRNLAGAEPDVLGRLLSAEATPAAPK